MTTHTQTQYTTGYTDTHSRGKPWGRGGGKRQAEGGGRKPTSGKISPTQRPQPWASGTEGQVREEGMVLVDTKMRTQESLGGSIRGWPMGRRHKHCAEQGCHTNKMKTAGSEF